MATDGLSWVSSRDSATGEMIYMFIAQRASIANGFERRMTVYRLRNIETIDSFTEEESREPEE